MVHDSIDVERCVWDLEYRNKVRRAFDNRNNGEKTAANQNLKKAGGKKGRAEANRPS